MIEHRTPAQIAEEFLDELKSQPDVDLPEEAPRLSKFTPVPKSESKADRKFGGKPYWCLACNQWIRLQRWFGTGERVCCPVCKTDNSLRRNLPKGFVHGRRQKAKPIFCANDPRPRYAGIDNTKSPPWK